LNHERKDVTCVYHADSVAFTIFNDILFQWKLLVLPAVSTTKQ
jgi:hypothetical protein